jgi:hypothetical protein
MKMMGKIKSILIFVFCCLPPHLSFAAENQTFIFYPGLRIKAEVSAKEFTRLQFDKKGVAEVVGDENKYQLLSDEFSSNIFIKPKIAAGNTFAISVIATSGEVQDMDLVVVTGKPKSILIAHDLGEKSQDDLLNEAAWMLKAMQGEKYGKYYVQKIKRKELVDIAPEFSNVLGKDTKLVRQWKKQIYRFKGLTGVVLEVKNDSNKVVFLEEKYFNRLFASTIATSISTLVLLKGECAKVFIVTKKGIDND